MNHESDAGFGALPKIQPSSTDGYAEDVAPLDKIAISCTNISNDGVLGASVTTDIKDQLNEYTASSDKVVSSEKLNYSQSPLAPNILNERVKQIAHHQSARRRVRGAFGGGILLATAGYAALATTHHTDFKISKAMPFEQRAQDAINGFDPELAKIGEWAILTSLGAIGLTKILSVGNRKLATIDEWSSQEMSADGVSRAGDVVSRVMRSGLRNTVAGRVPLVLAGGVMLGSMSSQIATSVTHGPRTAIANFMDKLQGDSLVVEYPGDFTMTDGYLGNRLTNNIVTQAQTNNVHAIPFDFNLGQLNYNDTRDNVHQLSDLSLGVPQFSYSSLYWSPDMGCNKVPVEVDDAAGLPIGKEVNVNGIDAEIVELSHGKSATNRIGVEMSLAAMGFCLEKSTIAPVTGIVLDAPLDQANSILKNANADNEAATVVSKAQFEHNSDVFWNANVLPLISILELSSLALTGVFAQRASKEQMIRLRREWAAKSASGISNNVIRATEILRATKDGIAASIAGGAASLLAPIAINTLVSGINASANYNNVMVGAAIGVAGPILGTLKNVIRPGNIIKVADNTRT